MAITDKLTSYMRGYHGIETDAVVVLPPCQGAVPRHLDHWLKSRSVEVET